MKGAKKAKKPSAKKPRPVKTAKRSPPNKKRVKAAVRSRAPSSRAVTPSKGLMDALQGGRTQARLFSLLVETAAAPILLLSPDLSVIEINSEAEQLYGRPRNELIGGDYFDVLDPGRQSGLARDDFKDVLVGKPVRGFEGRVRRPDGTERVLLWNATSLREKRSKPLGIIAVAQDITERQKAEEGLREREARLSSIIETAPDAIITIDPRGIVQSFSAASERLFGYSAGEVIGHNVSILMASPYKQQHDGYLERYHRTGEKRIIGIGRTVEARRKDGTIFPMELAVGEVRIGTTHIFTGFIRDLSARAKMEEELRQAQKMEAIGQLTGGLAHDFNNLLTVITGNLEMLETRMKEREDREILNEAQEAAELGAKLANRLLAFGRRQPLNPKPIDLSALVGGMADLLRRSLGESIKVETLLSPSLPSTLTDPGQIENVLLNLAINARDAMPDGGKLIIETKDTQVDQDYASAYADVQPGHYVMLTVTDTGTGMSPEVKQRAFEPFYTTKGPGAGSGLGLSMVYGFVKQSGGHVQLYSEVGLGTTVRIYLPVKGEAKAAEEGVPKMKSARGANNETILVVEDDERVRRVSVRRLTELGYRIIEAEDGPAAIAILKRDEPIDLVFTDVVMPGGMTGIDLAQAIRKLRPSLKILFTSGYAEPAIINNDVLTSNADWLGKPYRSADLALKVRALLDG
jgi:PAS domain S-box-containing protein